MPTYNYLCNQCGHRFDAFQAISADAITDCPNCNGVGTVQRLITGGAGIVFKGTGFYVTDYRKDSGKSSDGGGSTSSSGSSSAPAAPAASGGGSSSSTSSS